MVLALYDAEHVNSSYLRAHAVLVLYDAET